MLFTHLPSQDTKCVHVAGCRGSSISHPEAFRVNKLRGGAVKEPVDIHPCRDEWNGGRSKTGNMSASTSVDEYIGLDEYESVAKMWTSEGAYNLEVPVNDAEAVHILHSPRYS